MMRNDSIIKCIDSVAQCFIDSEDEIESLDRAIGDGDHYINIKRGSFALQAIKSDLKGLPIPDTFKKIGMTLMSSIGGASGPLFASFFITFSKHIKDGDSLQNFSLAFSHGVESIIQRGKAKLGDKTMLDVLIPVSEKLRSLTDAGCELNEIIKHIDLVAKDGVLSTKKLMPTKGRAAGLGDRAIGHIDPGAKTCQLIVSTVCDELK